MSVGIILKAQQAEAVLEKGQAVLIGRPPVAIHPPSRITGRTISAPTAGSRTGRRNLAGGSKSGAGPWKVLQRRLALSRGVLA